MTGGTPVSVAQDKAYYSYFTSGKTYHIKHQKLLNINLIIIED